MALALTSRITALAAAIAVSVSGTAQSADSDNASLIDPQADALVKKMSDYMGGLKSFSVNAYVFDEQIMGDAFKMSVLRSGVIKVQRPDKFYVSRTGELRDQEAFFDGSTLVIHGKRLDAAVEVPAKGDIDAGLSAAAELAGNELPARDLLARDSYTPLIDAVEESAYLGKVAIGGETCRHLAFRTAEVDWQLWVSEGERTLPCRYTITSKWLTGAPQYTITFANWKTDQAIPADTFEFKPAKGTKTMTPEEFRKQLTEVGGE